MRIFVELDDADWLRRKYETERLNAVEIARELGCTADTVYRAMRKHGIASRPKWQATRMAKSGCDLDEAKAAELYRAGASTTDLTKLFGSSSNTILAALKRQGVKTRSAREAQLIRRNVAARRMPKASAMVGVTARCAACGRSDGLELHHVDGDISNNADSNLLALCWEHHMLVELLVTRALQGAKLRGILNAL